MDLRTASSRLEYQPALDGIRGISILFVLLCHGMIVPNGFGFIAVNTFFVLSGFLITSLLVSEWDLTGRISLRKFYARRALRLLPALTVMLILFVIFVFLTDPYKRAIRESHEAIRAFFYMTNWAGIFRIGRTLSLAHTWSLSVEEQFYIVWPCLLIFLLKKTNRPSMACWLFLAAFCAVVYRIGIHMCGTTNIGGNILPVEFNRVFGGTDTRADSLLFGCFAGVLTSSNLLPRGKRFATALKLAAAASAIALIWYCFQEEESARMIRYGWGMSSLCAMVLILHLVTSSGTALHQLLKFKPLVYVGQISYGLYVWHFPILKAMQQHHWPWQNLGYLALVIPVTLASYYVIERPCLRLKRKFEPKVSGEHPASLTPPPLPNPPPSPGDTSSPSEIGCNTSEMTPENSPVRPSCS